MERAVIYFTGWITQYGFGFAFFAYYVSATNYLRT